MNNNNTLRLLFLLSPLLLLGLGCEEGASQQGAFAHKVTSREQLIGGPTGLGEIGDYLLENGEIRVIVQQLGYNRGSGLFGGSLIDADIVRDDRKGSSLGGNGNDVFGELFPAFFAEMIDPDKIEILNDGTDGKPAVVEVSGFGGEFITMARYANQLMVNSYEADLFGILGKKPPTSNPEKARLRLYTRYILKPGAKHVEIESRVENYRSALVETPPPGTLDLLRLQAGIDLKGLRIPAGQVVGFGNLSKLFAPGIGFDLKFGLQRAYKNEVDLPAFPGLVTDLVASANGSTHVSYGYATKIDPEMNFVAARSPAYGPNVKPGDFLLLFYASGFTGIYTHQLPEKIKPGFCGAEGEDAETRCNNYYKGCDTTRASEEECAGWIKACVDAIEQCDSDSWQDLPDKGAYTNYFIVGRGDVDSVRQELYKIRNQEAKDNPDLADVRVETRKIFGIAEDQASGARVKSGSNIVLYKPDEEGKCDNATHVYSQTTTSSNGEFVFTVPKGSYCLRVQRSHHPLGPMKLYDTENPTALALVAPSAGKVLARVLDEKGRPLPAKIRLVGTHEYKPNVSHQDYLFDLAAGESWVSTDFVEDTQDPETRRYIESTAFCEAHGGCEITGRPGKYTVVISRGPTYEIFEKEINLKAGELVRVNTVLKEAFKLPGYQSGDFHIHARGSIDCGVENDDRLRSVAGEGVDLAISTEHNYLTDFKPFLFETGLQKRLSTLIGVELTTFEAGHFNAFPLKFKPGSMNHGSIPWQDLPPTEIFGPLREMAPDKEVGNIIQVNHPRMNIMGYFTQHYVDSFDTTVHIPFGNPDAGLTNVLAAPNGDAFVRSITDDDGNVISYESTIDWNFDAIEVFNSKHFEEIRTLRMPLDKTKGEISDELLQSLKRQYAQYVLIDKTNTDLDSLEKVLAKFKGNGANDSTIKEMKPQERNNLLNMYLYGLANGHATLSEIPGGTSLNKIKEAADKWAMDHIPNKDVILCEGNKPISSGVLDDWYNLLNYPRPNGEYKRYTATGNSDSHSTTVEEIGYPRNFFFAGHNNPGAITGEQLVKAIKSHNNFVTNGPVAMMTIDGQPMGSDVVANNQKVEIEVKIYAAPWVGADRFRIVANGETLRGLDPKQTTDVWGWVPVELDDSNSFEAKYTVDVTRDTWFVIEVESDKNLFPVVSPLDRPSFSVEGIVGSLGGALGMSSDKTPGMERVEMRYITGFGFSNPIWVHADGDDEFTPLQPKAERCEDNFYSGALVDIGLSKGDDHHHGHQHIERTSSQVIGPEKIDRLARPTGERRDLRAIFQIFGSKGH